MRIISPPYCHTIGRLVQTLSLPYVNSRDSGSSSDGGVGGRGEGLAEQKDVRTVLLATSKIQTLTLAGSAALKALLSVKMAAVRLSELENLIIEDLDAQVIPLYDMRQLGALRTFPKLETLSISIDQGWEERTSNLTPRCMPPFPQIKSLELTAGLSLSTSNASNFLSHFNRLTSLDITLNDLAEISLLLSALPPTLLSLSLEFDLDLEWSPNESGIVVNQHLDSPRFSKLKRLALGKKTYSAALFAVLVSSLPQLKSLSLDIDDFNLDASLLLRYLAARGGPRKALKDVNLDGPYICADLIPSEHPDRPSVENGTFLISEWWVLPRWTDEFSFEQAKAVVEKAKEVGIKLTGVLGEAIEVEEMRRREERYLRDRADDIYLALADLFAEAEI
jgi:hypothetical protein